MPNSIVLATGEAMPATRLNRSAIMKAAWENYRHWHAVRESIHGPMKFCRKEFAFKLQIAWRNVKLAAMSGIERRCAAIRAEIDGLKYKSFQINTEPTRTRLEAELWSLAAA